MIPHLEVNEEHFPYRRIFQLSDAEKGWMRCIVINAVNVGPVYIIYIFGIRR